MGKSWIELIRPSNVLTAISDVLAGVAVACLFLNVMLPQTATLLVLCLASMLLYTGGIVFNDVMDAKLDQVERPERPIPSGRISRRSAIALGTASFVIGVALSLCIGWPSFYMALVIVLLCLMYNGIAKHHFLFGPITMGLCRGFNLLLGVSVLPAALDHSYVALVTVLYIASVTTISRGEVYGGNRTALRISAILYAIVIGTLVYYAGFHNNLIALGAILAFALMIFIPLVQAYRQPQPANIRKAVKLGVLALILLNSSWIAISGFWSLAFLTLCTLPISIFLAKRFAVT